MTRSLSLAMQRYYIDQKKENMLKDMEFYHLRENIKNNYLIKD